MKMGQLIMARNAIDALYQMRVDAPTAIRIRTTVRRINELTGDFDQTIRQWAERERIVGQKIDALTPSQREYYLALHEVDVEASWEPLVTLEDLSGSTLSAAHLDALIAIGLIRDSDTSDTESQGKPAINTV